jgi:filamentous hemagglutinin family protein
MTVIWVSHLFMKSLIKKYILSCIIPPIFLSSPVVHAQITPDQTLPSASVVIPQGTLSRITGGTVAGSNLFHSFEAFSIAPNHTVWFDNSTQIQNIFSRVTGSNISQIEGLLQANGQANFFLINPNGIVFGPNAKLAIGGSLITSSANQIIFADGRTFSATKPSQDSLLTVNVPIGLQFGPNPGKIQVSGPAHQLRFESETLATLRENRPDGIQVKPGQTLALVGGNISFSGGNLTAPAGRIELGSVANTTVSLTSTAAGWQLSYPQTTQFRDINLSNAASLSTSGRGGGNIQLVGRQITLSNNATVLADTLGDQAGGSLVVRASEKVELTSPPTGFSSSLFASVDPQASGNGGNVLIETPYFRMADGAIVGADTFGSGNAGSLTIRANLVELLTGSVVETAVYSGATGQGGHLTIEADRVSVKDGAQVLSLTRASGSAGPLSVKAKDIELIGTSATGELASVFAASVESRATGNGGTLTIETERLRVANGARVGVSSSGFGNAGELKIQANQIEVVGTDINGAPSMIAADTSNQGNGGNLTINTQTLSVREGAQIAAGTFGSRPGGNISIKASDWVQLSGSMPAVDDLKREYFRDASDRRFPSGFFASSEGTGDAGTLRVETNSLQIQNGAQISVSAQQKGTAGNLSIMAPTLFLNRGILSADTASGRQGNISILSRNIQLRNRSSIATNATGNATGGNISINTETLTALENSDISANALASFGGRVTVNSSGVFGIQIRDEQTAQSDITATSNLGSEFRGSVNINTPDVDPASGLVQLSDNPIDPSTQIAQRCAAARKGSQFIITGRGGLPDDPTQPLRTTTLWSDMRPILGSKEAREWGNREVGILKTGRMPVRLSPSSASSTSSPNPQILIEATGWKITPAGQVQLVANISDGISPAVWNSLVNCHDSSIHS